MRELDIGTKKHTVVHAQDLPGPGGACHVYHISPADNSKEIMAGKFGGVFFQCGPIKENGVNGCHNEDLIAIVIDRLQHFQAGPYKCRENALALTKLEEALHWLNHRTQARVDRGVEGTSEK
jgi:hypothetical protein